MEEKEKIIIIIVSLLGIIIIVGLVFAGNYLYNLAVNPNSSKELIFGTKDEDVEVSTNAANCEKEKVTVEGATHAEAATTNPELYWRSIKNFINKQLI